MSWKYYKKGKLIKECNDISEDISFNDVPETVEDAVNKLRANGIDVSDCVIEPELCSDNWSPDYPPEEDEYDEYALTHTVGRDDIEQTPLQKLFVEPLTNEEVEHWDKLYKILEKENRTLKTGDDFMDNLHDKINPSRMTRFKRWCSSWTDEEVTYLIGWLFIAYLMVGIIKYQPSILNVILWPFI